MTEIDKIIEYLYSYGYFSEYLPAEFSIKGVKKDFSNSSTGLLKPYQYSMSRFKDKFQRRTIHIPDLFSYLALIEYLDNNKEILSRIIILDQNNKISFSKIIYKGEVVRFDNKSNRIITTVSSVNTETDNDELDSKYISNLKEKINESMGAQGILYLDIANFFGSFYTHNITALFSGAEWALDQFESGKKHKKREYILLQELDKKVRRLNKNRSIGLLVGPFISRIIAETLLGTIDKEIIERNIKYVRFMDDYEIFVYDENEIEMIINEIEEILNKYGLHLNHEKTNYKPIPYSDKKDLTTYFEHLKKDMSVINIFNSFIEQETKLELKGAVKYFASRILEFDKTDRELLVSLITNIIINNPNSTIVAINRLIELVNKENDKNLKNKVIDVLYRFLILCKKNKYDLEQVWLVYAILKINPNYKFKKVDFENLNELAMVVILGETDAKYGKYINEYYGNCFILDYEMWIRDIRDDLTFFIENDYYTMQKEFLKLRDQGFYFYRKE